MKRITFDKIWKARMEGYSNEEASRGFYIDDIGGIHRIESMDVFDSDIEAAYYAKSEYGYKIINVCLHYPYLMFLYDYVSIRFVDCPTTKETLRKLNNDIEDCIDLWVNDYLDDLDS